MKVFLIVLSISFFLVSCKQEPVVVNQKGDAMHQSDPITVKIVAKSGLTMREDSAITAKKIVAIPRGTIVTVTDLGGPEEVIENRASCWVKVEFQEQQGWVFGGFVQVETEDGYKDFYNNRRFFVLQGHGFKKEALITGESGFLVKPLKKKSSGNSTTFQFSNYSFELKENVTNVSRIVIFGKRELGFGLTVGSRLKSLLLLLGEPQKEYMDGTTKVLVYSLYNDDAMSKVEIRIKNGRAEKYIWSI